MADQQQLAQWLVERVSTETGIAAREITLDVSLLEYGIDSAAAIGVMADLEDFVRQPLDPNLFYEFPSIRELSQHLAGLTTAGAKQQSGEVAT
ncbi:MAG: acyl carrier protein [Burkholderiaceae bacterium]